MARREKLACTVALLLTSLCASSALSQPQGYPEANEPVGKVAAVVVVAEAEAADTEGSRFRRAQLQPN